MIDGATDHWLLTRRRMGNEANLLLVADRIPHTWHGYLAQRRGADRTPHSRQNSTVRPYADILSHPQARRSCQALVLPTRPSCSIVPCPSALFSRLLYSRSKRIKHRTFIGPGAVVTARYRVRCATERCRYCLMRLQRNSVVVFVQTHWHFSIASFRQL